ncbi:MAG: tRNA (cytidine(56)-2'-O)-methyltransferase [Candidatus Methanomethylicia archaeon]|nr:tRNA (cytidine(56)-2'-O)-methyltransferase [Candidatus Methanomethylicia archaeon]MCQ5374437.1 tRNA (cytidine(56)-2'-O)-methyltransferase [Candidatus Methanomethylicia archaeon]
MRIGHRPGRDKRITSHVCLVARAFGAEGIYISGARDQKIFSTIKKVCETWGGSFWVEFVSNPLKLIKNWKNNGGIVVHLTMYGLPLREITKSICQDGRDLLVIVGGEKVPKEYYLEADYNVAVGNQPHSEVSALAIFLDRINNGEWEHLTFSGAKLRIIPSERGKIVREFKEEKKDF